ncbi:hypothetical protein PO883_33910 [Massilia sp. DJPM01]|uniref:hypothetical protein n=1 Tax=Massilia sp. DJPM01 TaxID=3024404 RepID=UPI00259FCC41|nr:hypothetical protein [Massilia sp. DJPM01]MDM5182168.1 hypothetical protein [Massilia sp. DJPM01]
MLRTALVTKTVGRNKMANLSLQDLIIRLHEQDQSLQMFTQKRGGGAGELSFFHELSDLDMLSEETVEEHIGRAVLAFLSAKYESDLFGLDRYRQAGKSFAASMDDESALLLASGDAENEFEGAMLRIYRFDESWTLEDIEGMTALLERAARSGSKKAKKFLREDWPERSLMFRKRLERSG